jgi:hypothetical protein
MVWAFRMRNFANRIFREIGSLEAGCKSMEGKFKQYGMFRTVRGANTIIAPMLLSAQVKFADYWESRWAAGLTLKWCTLEALQAHLHCCAGVKIAFRTDVWGHLLTALKQTARYAYETGTTSGYSLV